VNHEPDRRRGALRILVAVLADALDERDPAARHTDTTLATQLRRSSGESEREVNTRETA
jgi:hypothetical protein